MGFATDKSSKSELLRKALSRIEDITATIRAVEELEYHDQNWLAHNPKTRNEGKRELLDEAARLIQECYQLR